MLSFFVAVSEILAQTYNLTGRIVENTDSFPKAGATVSLIHTSDSKKFNNVHQILEKQPII
jgi:hypothetical protein